MSPAPRARQLGVTDTDYLTMLEQQGGHCALCPATPKTRRFSVDHDHKTMKIRGLLCHKCNRALPSWMGVPWLLRAVEYLHHPPATVDGLLAVTVQSPNSEGGEA